MRCLVAVAALAAASVLCSAFGPLGHHRSCLTRPSQHARAHTLHCQQYDSDDLYNEEVLGSSSGGLKQLLIRFDCELVDSDVISEALFELGVLSVSVEVEAMQTDVYNDEKKWADLQKTRSWKSAVLRANVPASFDTSVILQLLGELYDRDLLDVSSAEVETKDWVLSVQQNWPPQVIGDLTVRFPWHSAQTTGTRHELVLQGGAAFGTGDHPTTRLCCQWIQRCVERSPGQGLSVLDYGTGSGLLGLAALKYGAREASGTDIDKDALLNARGNCEQNGLHMDLYLVSEDECASAEEQSIARMTARGASHEFMSSVVLEDKTFDLTVANILAPILISLAPTLARHTKVGGRIAMSGLVSQQSARVIEEFEPYFDELMVEAEEEDWVVVTGRRRG